jgi:hypothetical protein
MKHIFSVAAAFCFMLLISCKNEADKQQTVASPTRTLLSTPINTSPGTTTTDPITTNTATTNSIKNDTITTPTKSANLALNPKHGEPGHRCDIPEGAPLNSPVVKNPIQTTTPTTNTTTTPANVVKTVPTTSNLNPKHGEPGHRCDIAVGAPLNSKPQQ